MKLMGSNPSKRTRQAGAKMAQAWTGVVTGQERLLNRDRTPRGATTVLAVVRVELEATREVKFLDSSPVTASEPAERRQVE